MTAACCLDSYTGLLKVKSKDINQPMTLAYFQTFIATNISNFVYTQLDSQTAVISGDIGQIQLDLIQDVSNIEIEQLEPASEYLLISSNGNKSFNDSDLIFDKFYGKFGIFVLQNSNLTIKQLSYIHLAFVNFQFTNSTIIIEEFVGNAGSVLVFDFVTWNDVTLEIRNLTNVPNPMPLNINSSSIVNSTIIIEQGGELDTPSNIADLTSNGFNVIYL